MRVSRNTHDYNSGAASGGVGFFSLLGLLFIGLKLAGFIDWPWWVVMLPIWGPIVFVLMLLGGIAFALAVKKHFEE